MSRIIKCDRCGAEFAPKTITRIGYVSLNWRDIATDDLQEDNPLSDMDYCEDCMRAIAAFIEQKPAVVPIDPPAAVEKPKASAKKKIDTGKLQALYEAGWPVPKIADELGITSDEYVSWQSQLKVTGLVSLNEFMEAGNEPVSDATYNSHFITPEDNISKEELKKVLSEALKQLTEKEQKVILLYYYEDLTLKEIARVLEVSESRVSQLHTRALMKLKKTMGPYYGLMQE